MKLSKIINCLEEKFPKNYSEEWDNVGLQVGRRSSEINKILLSLDLTEKVIKEAITENVQLIITHHPMIFKPLKAVTGDSTLGKKILSLIENNIAVYSMHTNLDSGKFGLNDYLGENILGFEKGEILDKKEIDGEEIGIGRLYKLNSSITIDQLILEIKEKLNIEKVSLVLSKENLLIKKVALISGSGASYWRKAKKLGADILITGDVKYHEALDAKEENFSLIDIGHFESEQMFGKILENILKENFDIEINYFNDGPIFQNK
ncbi:Nif3-like dinuclear metal center hexameric protein [uncultured Cetobacterium sp.]|uniref:Nif3-like dinuclear metal center hexameric protein n=1 Tax=uncultured Cetobacterium sp. TaxID=527638 RepID=UPI00260B8437|nr:Nif3-like dinuclear metal center hexameric protein [uncultured Cetobacterium sp.]